MLILKQNSINRFFKNDIQRDKKKLASIEIDETNTKIKHNPTRRNIFWFDRNDIPHEINQTTSYFNKRKSLTPFVPFTCSLLTYDIIQSLSINTLNLKKTFEIRWNQSPCNKLVFGSSGSAVKVPSLIHGGTGQASSKISLVLSVVN